MTAGITCMYSSSHTGAAQTAVEDGSKQQQTLQTPAATATQNIVQEQAVQVADTAVHAEVPAGPSVELSNATHTGPDNSLETGTSSVAPTLKGLYLNVTNAHIVAATSVLL